MAPIPKIMATMQPRRAGVSDSEPKLEPPLAVSALQSKKPALYAQMIEQKMTLHKDYNSIKCISQKCKHCNTFYDHIDAKRQKRRLKSTSDHEGEVADTSGSAPILKLGESAVDVAFTLQKVLGYLDATFTMEELAGVVAATELATYKNRVAALETERKQLIGQVKALRSQPPTTSQKRPAEEDINPRADKRVAGSGGDATAILPVSAADLADPDSVWNRLHNMSRPGPQDDYLLLAQWLQHREVVNFKGVPLSAPNFDVDLRDVRGHQQVFSRVPHPTHGSDPAPKRRRRRCIIALMRILTVPGLYRDLICQHSVLIDALPRLTSCDFPESADEVDLLSNEEIVVLLAKRGLSLADADDLWQFCYRYIRAEFAAGESEFQNVDLIKILASAEDALKSRGFPPGLNTQQEDIYRRTVPSHRRPQVNNGAKLKKRVFRGK